MSEVKVNKISPRSGTGVTLGDSGDKFTVPSGSNITIDSGATIVNDGTATGFDTDTNDKVKVTTNDTTPGFLTTKILAGTNISLTTGNPSGDETLTIANTYAGIEWQSVVTAATLTAVAGRGYPINTTSNTCTVTLPAAASVGDQIIFTDYARNWGTNALTINQNSLNYQGQTSPNPVYDTNGESIHIVYTDATKGWIPLYDGAVADEVPQTYTIDALVIGGGGGGGGGNGGGGGGGGVGLTNGVDSTLAGSGVPTTPFTSTGGGSAGYGATAALAGGAGGGSGYTGSHPGGAGNTPSTSPSQGATGGAANTAGPGYGCSGGGGGGASGSIGSNGNNTSGGAGGAGTTSSITGAAVVYAGGGGGNNESTGTPGTGGSGGGGNGGNSLGGGSQGVDGKGGGGGGRDYTGGTPLGFDGGIGVIILSMPDADYSGTTTGSPTVDLNAGGTGKTVLTYTGTGSYTT